MDGGCTVQILVAIVPLGYEFQVASGTCLFGGDTELRERGESNYPFNSGLNRRINGLPPTASSRHQRKLAE